MLFKRILQDQHNDGRSKGSSLKRRQVRRASRLEQEGAVQVWNPARGNERVGASEGK